jgi:hypothetical protein
MVSKHRLLDPQLCRSLGLGIRAKVRSQSESIFIHSLFAPAPASADRTFDTYVDIYWRKILTSTCGAASVNT